MKIHSSLWRGQLRISSVELEVGSGNRAIADLLDIQSVTSVAVKHDLGGTTYTEFFTAVSGAPTATEG